MKRYALFVYDWEQSGFGARGGWHDFEGFFDDLELAKQTGINWVKGHAPNWTVMSWQVVDLPAGVIAADGTCTLKD